MSEPLLVATDLEREYRIGPEPVRVLKGASLTVNVGETVAVIGASGVGKSTLLHILGTLDRPTSGRVLFAGEDVFARSEAGLARLRRSEVGFVFQFYNLLGEMTALENAMLPALIQRVPAHEARERASVALGEVGLSDRLGHRPGELSGGEQQRVAIARALVGAPRLILADEQPGPQDERGHLGPVPEAGRGARLGPGHRHPQSRARAPSRPWLSARGRARARLALRY